MNASPLWRDSPIDLPGISNAGRDALNHLGIHTIGELSTLLRDDQLSHLGNIDFRSALEIRDQAFVYLTNVFLSIASELHVGSYSSQLSSLDLPPRLSVLAQNEGCSTLEELVRLVEEAGPHFVRLQIGWHPFVDLVDKLGAHLTSLQPTADVTREVDGTTEILETTVREPLGAQTTTGHLPLVTRYPTVAAHAVTQSLTASAGSNDANSNEIAIDTWLKTTETVDSIDNATDKNSAWHERPIDVLGLSVRSCNSLRRAGIRTLGLLAASLDSKQFLGIRNVGLKTHSEISEKLQAYLATLPDHDIGPAMPQVEDLTVAEPELFEITSIDQDSPNLLTGNEQPGDTTAHLCPYWHCYSIQQLDLPPRLRHALERGGYTTLGHLASLAEQSDPADAHITGFGWKSFAEMKDRLKAYLSSLPESAFVLVEPAKFGSQIVRAPADGKTDVSLPDRIAKWLAVLSDRNYRVISWRYGFAGEPLTLDAVGEKLGLTRERIRQIESKTIRQLKHPKYDDLVESVMMIIAPAFEQSGGIMSDDEVTKLAAQFAPEIIDGLGLMRLLSETWKEFTRYNRAEVWVWGDKSELLLDAQAQVVEILRAARAPLDQITLLDRLRQSAFYHHHGPELTETFLKACLRTYPNIEHREDSLLGLTAWAKHRTDDIIMTLREIGHPAHYTEITELVNGLLPEDMQTEPHNIHAQMQRNPDFFVRVGQGIYGLAEWGLETAEFYPDIIERVLRESGHPLSLQQVLSMVCEQRDCKESTVAMLLQFNDRFRPFPGGVYGLAEWHDDEFPDPSYREKRLVAAIADGEVRNKRKPKQEIAQALQDVDDLISSARSNGPYESQPNLLSVEAE